MGKFNCQKCGASFVKAGSNHKFCGRICYFLNKRGTSLSQEAKDKIRLGNSKPHSEERKKNISKAKTIPIAKEKQAFLKEYLQHKFLSHRLLRDRLKLRWLVYDREVNNIMLDNPELWIAEQERISYVDKNSGFTIENLLWLNQNVDKFTTSEIIEELKLTGARKIIIKRCKEMFNRSPIGCTKGKQTEPEQIMFAWLTNLSPTLDIQYNCYTAIKVNDKLKRYWVDFIVNDNCYIEVHGDYWHGNPLKYTIDMLNDIQKAKQRIDKEKRELITITQPNITYIEVWEHDLIKNTNKWKQQQQQIKECLQLI